MSAIAFEWGGIGDTDYTFRQVATRPNKGAIRNLSWASSF